MSLLIKGVDIPSGTYICIVEADKIWFVNNDNTIKFRSGEICKVPTPHGRLIDVNDLQDMQNWSEYIIVENAPTVIESEE